MGNRKQKQAQSVAILWGVKANCLGQHVIGAIKRMDTLHTKLHKLATELGLSTIKNQGYETKEAFVQKKLYLLKSYP